MLQLPEMPPFPFLQHLIVAAATWSSRAPPASRAYSSGFSATICQSKWPRGFLACWCLESSFSWDTCLTPAGCPINRPSQSAESAPVSPLAASCPSVFEGILAESFTKLLFSSAAAAVVACSQTSACWFSASFLPLSVRGVLINLLSVPPVIHHLHHRSSALVTFLRDFAWVFLFFFTSFLVLSVLVSRRFGGYFVLHQFSLSQCLHVFEFFKQL